MTALKNTSTRIVVLLVLQALWLTAAHSQQPGVSTFDQEEKKQQTIYQSRGENVPSGYVVDRSLLSYISTLPAGFDRSLANLGPTDRWLDIGAGEGNAVLDYYTELYDAMHWEGRERRGRKAQAVAISIEDRRTPEWYETAARLQPDQLRYLHGRRLREYSAEELGRFQLITDVIGGFSYARYLSVFMEKVLSFMDMNATFFTLLLDVRPETEPDPALYKDLLILTEIEQADGSDVKVCSWLKSISCVQVRCELNTELKRPIELYRIQKVCDKVAVPSLLPLSYQAGTPPPRRYRLGPPRPALLEELRPIDQ
ncbi:MAG: hypothetical protein ACREUB_10340 [Burkholderiales bacterium]